MIRFKQKQYSKALTYAGIGLSAASLGVSSANLYNNVGKRKSDVKFQKDQIKSTNELTRALNENSAIAKRTIESNENLYKAANSGKFNYLNSYNYNHPSASLDNSTKSTKKKKKFKLFSIQSGGFRRGNLNNENILTSEYNIEGIELSSPIHVGCFLRDLAKKSTFYYQADRELLLEEPTNHNPLQYPVNLVITGNVMSIALINPKPEDLSKLNAVLDRYCQSYDGADYSSEIIVNGNVYIIEVNIIGGCDLVNKMRASGLQLNIL